jgi:hypothetical protein
MRARSRPAAPAGARLAERPVAAAPDEVDDLHHGGHGREFRRDVLQPLGEGPLAAEDLLIGGAQRVDRRPVEAAALEPDDVEPAELGAVADRHRERNDVVGDAGEAADEGVGADPRPLLHCGKAAEDRVLADLDMAAKRDGVDEHDVIAEHAVMGDMGADHEKAVRADRRLLLAARRAAVDRDVLANDAVWPDDD